MFQEGIEMRVLNFRYVAAAMFAVVLSACGDSGAKARDVANEAAAKARETAGTALESAQATVETVTSNGAEEAAPSAPAPTVLTFDDGMTFDFGVVTEGDIVTHDFHFTNTGPNPLVFTDAKGSCGCTTAELPGRAIAPGESAVIKVRFDSSNKKGQRNQKVTLTANTDPAQTFLYLPGLVVDPADANVPDIR
jgi:hypothetical protein